MCQWWASRAGYPIGPSPSLDVPLTPKSRVESKSPHFKSNAKRLEIDENGNRAHLRTHWLAVNWYSFHQSPKWVNADRAKYVWSSSLTSGDDLVSSSVISSDIKYVSYSLFCFSNLICCLCLIDINECQRQTNPCPSGSSCLNSYGSYYCISGVTIVSGSKWF